MTTRNTVPPTHTANGIPNGNDNQPSLIETHESKYEDAPGPWQKVLWRKQPYPDNHVPTGFLEALQTNSNVDLPDTWTLIHLSTPISIQFNLIMIFISIFIHMLRGSLSAYNVTVLSTVISTMSWSLTALLTPESRGSSSRPQVRRDRFGRKRRGPVAIQIGRLLSINLLALVLFALSPVLRTLTEATTSDSIWALTAALFSLNFAMAGYNSRASSAQTQLRSNDLSLQASRSPGTQPKSIYIVAGQDPNAGGGLAVKASLNAAICASVVLASRLRSNDQVFTLLLLSNYIFALGPLFRVKVIAILYEREDRAKEGIEATKQKRKAGDQARAASPRVPGIPTSVVVFQTCLFAGTLILAITLFALLAILPSSPDYDSGPAEESIAGVRTTIILHLSFVTFLSLVCPMWMRRAQKSKRRLNGPWDPAVPVIRAPEL